MARLGNTPSPASPSSSKKGAIIGNSDPLVARIVRSERLPGHLFSTVKKYESISLSRAEKRRLERIRKAMLVPPTREEAAAKRAALKIETDEATKAIIAYAVAKRTGGDAPEPTERQKNLQIREDKAQRHKDLHGDGPPAWVVSAKYAEHRHKYGFILAEPFMVSAKYLQQPFVEKGLRSTLSPSLQRIPAITPAALNRRKAPKDGEPRQVLTTGDGKGDREAQWGKLPGLDCTYISILYEVTSGFRVDLDSNFVSLAALRQAILDCGLACLPHDIAYSAGPNGEVKRPHLWFLLKEGDEVWFSGREDCKANPRKLYKGVVLGVTRRLMRIGADIVGACNPRDGKSPLDPKLSFAVMNEVDYPSLEEWSHYVDTKGDIDREIRRHIVDSSGLPSKISNPLFTSSRAWCWDFLRAEHRSGKGPLKAAFRRVGPDKRNFTSWLSLRLLDAAEGLEHGCTKDRKKLKILMGVARYVAKQWDPMKMNGGEPRDRGAAYELTKDLPTGEEGKHDRQVAGSDYTHKLLVVKTLMACRDALRTLLHRGQRPTNKAIGELADRHPSTVKVHRQKIFASLTFTEEVQFWCLIGGHPSNPALIEQPTVLPEEDTYEGDLHQYVDDNGELWFGSSDWLQASDDDCSACLVRGGPGWHAHHPDAAWAPLPGSKQYAASIVDEGETDEYDDRCDIGQEVPASHEVPPLPVSQPIEVPVAACGASGGLPPWVGTGQSDEPFIRLWERLSPLRDAPSLSLADGENKNFFWIETAGGGCNART